MKGGLNSLQKAFKAYSGVQMCVGELDFCAEVSSVTCRDHDWDLLWRRRDQQATTSIWGLYSGNLSLCF